jgi:hypothetical protein
LDIIALLAAASEIARPFIKLQETEELADWFFPGTLLD